MYMYNIRSRCFRLSVCILCVCNVHIVLNAANDYMGTVMH